MNLSSVNRIIESSLYRRVFSFLGRRKNVIREKSFGSYKCDLYVQDTDTIIEIKSLLSFEANAQFPTVFSERANRQLEQIKELLSQGHKVCYMFVSMYSGVKTIRINDQQEEYYNLLCDCMTLGMKVYAFSLGMREEVPYVKQRVDIITDMKV